MNKFLGFSWYVVLAAISYWITFNEVPEEAESIKQLFSIIVAISAVICCIVLERLFVAKEQ